MKKKQIVKVYGGLGNQLFQYSFALYLKKFNKKEVLLDTNEFNYVNHHSGLELNKLIYNEFSSISFIKHFKYRISKSLYRYKFYKQEISDVNKLPSIEEFENIEYFDGYWQTYSMVNKVQDELFKSLRPLKINGLKINDNSVGIHVRRGDYLNSKEIYMGSCNIEYYKTAVEILNEKMLEPEFYIFSDDIPWCKQNFDFIKNKKFVDFNDSSFEDFILLIRLRNKIISNSTFSWWAAMLNKNSNIIVSPNKWNNQILYDDFLPKSWIKI